MIKRIVIIAICLAAIGSGAAWYLWSQQERSVVSNPLQAVPEDAALILRFSNFHSAFNHFNAADYTQELSVLGDLNRLNHWAERLDSLIISDSELAAMIGLKPWYVSYHYPNNKEAVAFYSHELGQIPNSEKLKGFFTLMFGSDATFSQHLLQGHAVYKAVFEEPFELTQFCIVNGVLLVSTNDSVLEKAISQLTEKHGLSENPSFKKLLAVDGENVDINMYLPFSNINDLLRPYLKKASAELLDSADSPAEWAQLDISFKENGVMLNGFTFTQDSSNVILDLLSNQEPQAMSMTSVLPSNTASAIYLGLNNMSAFRLRYREMLAAKGTINKYEHTVDSLNKALQLNVETSLFSWVGNGFGICITTPRSSKFVEQTYLLVNTPNAETAKAKLMELDLALSETYEAKPVNRSNNINIYSTQVTRLLPLLFGTSFIDLNQSYYMVWQDHIIFGHSISALRSYLKYMVADKELAKDFAFSAFSEHLGAKSNLFVYSRIRPSMPIFEKHLSYHTQGKMNTDEKGIEKFGSIALQLSSNKNAFYTNIYLSYEPEQEESFSGEQRAQLDTFAIITPTFVTNHYNGEPEVMVQDANLQLYLFNKNGKEIWKRQLDSRIKSPIHQVDAFKNRKIQFLFNTDDHIYLLDRKGNNVEGFPIKLKAKAITPVCVANYDGKRNYRLLITCANNHIYNYRISGKPTSGWKHNKAKDPTIKGFQHFTVGSKDYFVTAESNGKVHLLDRRGKNRVKVNKRINALSKQPLQVFIGKNQRLSAVYATDTLGTLYKVGLNGKVSSMKLANMSSDHTFLVTDMDNDGKPEFVFNDLNMLTIFDYHYQKIKELRLSPGTSGPFQVSLSNGEKALGFSNFDEGEINILNKELESIDGFPMTGYSKFDMKDKTEESPALLTTRGEGSELLIIGLE